LDIRFLKTLHLVAQLGSMADAARQLEISPAAVTHQLRALESDVGAKLVVRAGRSVVPTEAGHRFLNSTRSLLAQLDEALASVHGAAMVGELKVGSINSALHSVLPAVLARYAVAHPGVRLRVHADVSPHLFQQLQEDAIDVAVCQQPSFDLSKTFRWVLLKETPLVVLAHAEQGGRSPESLLRSEPFIRYDRRLAGGRQAGLYLRGKGVPAKEACELDSLLAIGLMVHQRLGVSLVPHFQSLLTEALEITSLALSDAPPARSFGLLWKTASPKNALIQAFIEYAELEARSGS